MMELWFYVQLDRE